MIQSQMSWFDPTLTESIVSTILFLQCKWLACSLLFKASEFRNETCIVLTKSVQLSLETFDKLSSVLFLFEGDLGHQSNRSVSRKVASFHGHLKHWTISVFILVFSWLKRTVVKRYGFKAVPLSGSVCERDRRKIRVSREIWACQLDPQALTCFNQWRVKQKRMEEASFPETNRNVSTKSHKLSLCTRTTEEETYTLFPCQITRSSRKIWRAIKGKRPTTF